MRRLRRSPPARWRRCAHRRGLRSWALPSSAQRGLAVGRAGLPDERVLPVGHDRLHLPVVDMERSSNEGEAVGSSGLLLGGCRALAAFAAAGEQSGDHDACDDE